MAHERHLPAREPAAQTGPSSDGYPGDALSLTLATGMPASKVDLQVNEGSGLAVEAGSISVRR